MPRISKQEFIRLRESLVSGAAIAKQLGVSPQAVDKMRKKHGIESRYVDYKKRDAAIRALYQKGTKVTFIADKYNISTVNVYRILGNSLRKYSREFILKLQQSLKTDEAIGKTLKITRQAVCQLRKRLRIPSRLIKNPKRNAAIIKDYIKGASMNIIGERYGLAIMYIYRILKKAGVKRKRVSRPSKAGKNIRFTTEG